MLTRWRGALPQVQSNTLPTCRQHGGRCQREGGQRGGGHRGARPQRLNHLRQGARKPGEQHAHVLAGALAPGACDRRAWPSQLN
jgi:hypothetical protein